MKHARWLLLCLALVAASEVGWIVGRNATVSAQGAPVVTPADIAGDSAAHALPINANARWVIFFATGTSGHVIRVGDANTSSSRGAPIAVGGAWQPPGGVGNLAFWHYYATSGDTLTVVWGN